MVFYKHYSFDLWLTLIKSNPLYKQERTTYFYNKFNTKDKHIDEIAVAFRKVDLMVNAINEKTGKNVDADEMCLMVIAMINDYAFPFNEIDLVQLDHEMEELALSHLPVLYGDECIDVLAEIKSTGLSSTNILSNTGFIKGKTLRKILNHLKLDQYLDFQLYSDEEGLDVSHVGIIIRTEDMIYIRHASSRSNARKVIDEDFMGYIANKPGVIILRPNQISSQEGGL